MFSRFSEALGRNKSKLSLEHLKYLHTVLVRNAVVTDGNKSLLVETLRSIAEILIWGDQNDNRVFDFFLEKNMLTFFLRILGQRTGRYVKVQLLQTLSILFENIRNETSIYYLLSNNHINEIIVHKFDFSDEEVLAYYISFIKTLSLRLNTHTIHFFFNEHLHDFPLYTEAIKFFNHHESMVRIAVRTLTLNVYKVDDENMLSFILNKTAVPYFSNLVWFIGSQSIELDACVKTDADHLRRNRLDEFVAEHLDHLHYLNDIVSLGIEPLSQCLSRHLLKKLFLPLYVYNLSRRLQIADKEPTASLSPLLSLFLLSQVFLIFTYRPLVSSLTDAILCGNMDASPWTHGRLEAPYVLGRPAATPDERILQSPVDIPMTPVPNSSVGGGPSSLASNSAASVSSVHGSGSQAKIRERAVSKRVRDARAEFTEAKEAHIAEEETPLSSGSGSALSPQHPANGSTTAMLPVASTSENGNQASGSPSVSFSLPDSGIVVNESVVLSGAASARAVDVAAEVVVDAVIVTGRLARSASDGDSVLGGRTSFGTVFRDALFEYLDCSVDDVNTLSALCLVHSMVRNQGIPRQLLEAAEMCPQRLRKARMLLDELTSRCSSPTISFIDGEDGAEKASQKSGGNKDAMSAAVGAQSERDDDADSLSATPKDKERPSCDASVEVVRKDRGSFASGADDGGQSGVSRSPYNAVLVERLLQILYNSVGSDSRVRLVTLEMAIAVLQELVYFNGASPCLNDAHMGLLEDVVAVSTEQLRAVCKGTADDIFLDMFEGEWAAMRPVNVEYLMMDPSILLPPTNTPLTGIEFTKRLPCGEVEKSRRAIRVFFMLRRLLLTLRRVKETELPLADAADPVQLNDVLDLNNSDLIACRVTDAARPSVSVTRFLVIDMARLILVEPDTTRLGWGVVRFVAFLQNVETAADKVDPRVLTVGVYAAARPAATTPAATPTATPSAAAATWSGSLLFDDHIRCLAARQYLEKGRSELRARKMRKVANLIGIDAAHRTPTTQQQLLAEAMQATL